jgi:urease accessory protein
MHRTALRIGAALFVVATILAPTVATAHPGHDGTDLVHGFLHPLGGVDHIIAMVAVGLLAARLGGRALWLVPASFVIAMAAAGVAGMAGIALPFAETGIAISVVVLVAILGGIAVFGLAMPVAAAMGLVAFFAVFHGYAHGIEMPETASGLAFGAGFVAATALLHAVGIGLGLAIGGKAFARRVA